MKVEANGVSLTLPESWNELDNRQLLTLYQVFFSSVSPAQQPAILATKRIQAMQVLAGWDDAFLKGLETGIIAETGDAEEGAHRFAAMLDAAAKDITAPYLETTEDGATSIRFALTRNPFPEFNWKHRGARHRYYGPADGLDNLSIYELCVAFTIFEAYAKAPGPALADELIATIYRPPKPPTPENKASAYGGDRRQPYQGYEAATPARKKRISTLPHLVKQVLLFWFASCRQDIIGRYPNLFSTDKRKGAERVGNDYGWGALLINLAGGMQHIEAIGRQSWQNAFTYLSYLEDQRKLADMRAAGRKT